MSLAAGAVPAGAGAHLEAEDAAAVLRALLAGERRVQPGQSRRPLNAVAVGEWAARVDDAEVVFFVDNASLDHVVSMRLEDGREAGFADWLMHDGANPLELIEEDERLALEQVLREAG